MNDSRPAPRAAWSLGIALFGLLALLAAAVVLPPLLWPPGQPDWLHPLHVREMDWQRAFQGSRNLGPWMAALTHLGPSAVLWAIVAAVFYLHDPRLGIRMAVMLLVAMWLRELLALGLRSPRPNWLDAAALVHPDSATVRPTFSLPSGHALIGAAFWFYLAAELRRGWFWILAGLIVATIAVTRVYLGVHHPSDVLLGALLGGLAAWLHRRGERDLATHLSRHGRQGMLLAAAAGTCGMLVLTGLVRSLATLPPAVDHSEWASLAQRATSIKTHLSLVGVLLGTLLGWILCPAPALSRGTTAIRLARFAVAGTMIKGIVNPTREFLEVAVPGGWPFVARGAAWFAIAIAAGWIAWGLIPQGVARIGGQPPGKTTPSQH